VNSRLRPPPVLWRAVVQYSQMLKSQDKTDLERQSFWYRFRSQYRLQTSRLGLKPQCWPQCSIRSPKCRLGLGLNSSVSRVSTVWRILYQQSGLKSLNLGLDNSVSVSRVWSQNSLNLCLENSDSGVWSREFQSWSVKFGLCLNSLISIVAVSLSEEFDLGPKSLISVSISVWTIRSQESDLNSVNLGL